MFHIIITGTEMCGYFEQAGNSLTEKRSSSEEPKEQPRQPQKRSKGITVKVTFGICHVKLREWQIITNTAAGIRSQIMELGETEEPLPLVVYLPPQE